MLAFKRGILLFTYKLTTECEFGLFNPNPVAATLVVAHCFLYAKTTRTLMTTIFWRYHFLCWLTRGGLYSLHTRQPPSGESGIFNPNPVAITLVGARRFIFTVWLNFHRSLLFIKGCVQLETSRHTAFLYRRIKRQTSYFGWFTQSFSFNSCRRLRVWLVSNQYFYVGRNLLL